MKLEDQVVPLALAQRMKELGFPQQSTLHVWFWSEYVKAVGRNDGKPDSIEGAPTRSLPQCAAPTVAEMGEWLPAGFLKTFVDETRHEIRFRMAHANSIYVMEVGEEVKACGTTESEARARLLIALAEAGALDPKRLA